MIQDVQNFISNNKFFQWYLDRRTRLNRKWFNIIFFVISSFGLVLYYYDYKDTLDQLNNTLVQSVGGQHNGQSGDISKSIQTQELIQKMRQVQSGNIDAAEDIMALMDTGEDSPFRWSVPANILIFLSLIPLMRMRLRDIGKKEDTISKIIVFACAPLILSFLDLIGLTFLSFLSIPAFIIGFVLLSWMAMAKSEAYIPPSQRVQMPETEKVARPDPTPVKKKGSDYNYD